MKNPRSFRFSQFLNDVLQNRLARLFDTKIHFSFEYLGVITSVPDTDLYNFNDPCTWFISPGSWTIMMLKYKRMF